MEVDTTQSASLPLIGTEMDVDYVNSPAPPLLKVLSRLSLDGTRPVTDPKHYRLVTLDNGLEALLIHDPRITPRADDGEEIRKRRMKHKEEEEGEEDEDEEEEDEEEEDEEEEEEEEASGSCSSADSGSSAGDEDDEELDVDASDPSCKHDQPGPTGRGTPPGVDSLDESACSSQALDSHERESPRRKKRHSEHSIAHPPSRGHGEEKACEGNAGPSPSPLLAPPPKAADRGGGRQAATPNLPGMEGAGGGGGEVRLCGAAMAVGVGSFHDPVEIQGLAHYLEHMLFMGSHRYPEENAYDAFLSQHGGYSNAMTECEYTVYHFEVPPASFTGALDIFAQFFIDPLMRPEASARELEAIESEFNLSRSSDSTRWTQLMCHTCHASHPYARFAWGNLASLRDAPQAAGLDINAEMRRFYGQHYRAPNMKLVLLGMEDLDTLENILVRTFAGGLPPPMDESNALGWLFRIVPFRDLHELHLTWPLPSLLSQYRSKPWEYLGHLLGHEGPGSILAALKARGEATAIVAGVSHEGYDSSTGLALFTLTVTLTEAGVRAWEEIVGVVYAYLGAIRRAGWQRWVYEELAAIARMQYTYQEEVETGELVEHLAVGLLPMYGLERTEFLEAPFLLRDWRPEWLEAILVALSDPTRCRVDVASSRFGRAGAWEAGPSAQVPKKAGDGETGVIEGISVETEPRFGVHFTRERLAPPTLQAWKDIFNRAAAGDALPGNCPALFLPQPNPFIATDLTVKALPLPLEGSNPPSPPSLPPSAPPTHAHESLLPPAVLDLHPGSPFDLTSETLEKALHRLHTASPELVPALARIRASLPPASHSSYPTLLPPPSPPSPFHALHLWHLQDHTFRTPRSCIYLKLATPHAYASARQEVMTELFVRLVKESLNEVTYLASVAELHYGLKATELGLELTFHGLSDKLLRLVELVLRRLLVREGGSEGGKEDPLFPSSCAGLSSPPQAVRFAAQKEALIRVYANGNMKPSRHARNLRLGVLKEKMWQCEELEREARSLTLEAVAAFAPRLLEALQVDGLYQGNCDRADARALESLLLSLLQLAGTRPLSPAAYPSNRIAVLPPGHNLLLAAESVNAGERNSALEAYWQLGPDTIERRMVVQMLEKLIEEPLYDTLRTKEQLGYSVSCGLRMTNGILGLAVKIQSERYEPEHLHARLEVFLQSFHASMSTLPPSVYARQLVALAQNKLQRDASLNEEAGRYWAEIVDRRFQFDVGPLEARRLLSVSLAQVLALFEESVGVNAEKARHAAVYVTGRACRSRRGGRGGREKEGFARSGRATEGEGGKEAMEGTQTPTQAPAETPLSDGSVVKPEKKLGPLLLSAKVRSLARISERMGGPVAVDAPNGGGHGREGGTEPEFYPNLT